MIDTIISSSVLILIILTIRYAFKGKINPMVQYGLWSLVVFRLAAFNLFDLHPVENPLSVMNAVNRAEATIRGASVAEQVISGHGKAGAIDNAVLIMDNVKTGIMTSGDGISAAAAIDWQLVLMIIWAIGAFALGMWLILVNLKFGKTLVENRTYLMSVRSDDQGILFADGKGLVHRDAHIDNTKLLSVYMVKELDSPCLMGYRGEVAIYIPSEIASDKEKLRFAIAHELGHYKHHDLTWSIVRGGLLVFYWFNPLVWAAAIMSKRDCELACDHAVLKAIGKEDRLAYGRTLVDMISQSGHKNDVLQVATTMYGSANGVKERVATIVKNKKMKGVTLVAVLLITVLAVGCTFTAAPNNPDGLSSDDNKEIEAFAVKWANAFSQRDAKTIYELCENEELYLTIGGIAENGEYWMGWSSPWPWNDDYVIKVVDSSHLDIYYYFRTSEPSIYVAKETITVKKVDDTYKAAQVEMKQFQSIENKADFEEAFEPGFPDFKELAATYQAQADKNVRDMTGILENPVSAATHQLNLSGAKVSGVYQDKKAETPLAVVKFAWDDGEVEVNLIQPMLIDENGGKRQASIWVVVNEEPSNNNITTNNTTTGDTRHIDRISTYMEEECRKVFSPYYELLDFKLTNYHEEIVKGKVEAVFQYQIIHKNYDRDPDTVGYIKEAKESGNNNYQQMYDEYLQPKEMNFDLKVVIDEQDSITLYSNVSPVGIEWEETKMSDFILK